MTELAVADYEASVAWYRDVVGLRVELADPAHGFALLRGPDGGRLAVKAGTPVPGGVKVHLEVADVGAELARIGADAVVTEGVKESAEGYRRAVVRDPDGYAVVLFAWTGRAGQTTEAGPG